jgi:hypothetical protein
MDHAVRDRQVRLGGFQAFGRLFEQRVPGGRRRLPELYATALDG